MKLCWITSFSDDMYRVSGKPLIESFAVSETQGHLYVVTEGPTAIGSKHKNVTQIRFGQGEEAGEDILSTWLRRFADRIPRDLGGKNAGNCTCPGGPLGPHDKRHKMPCIAHWFCRNASRWFRKPAAIAEVGRVLNVKPNDPEDYVFVWVDADCRFVRRVPQLVVETWFLDHAAVFYHRDKRPVMEAGIVGYWMNRGAHHVLEWMLDCYMHGGWTGLQRWDDSYVLQKAIEKTPGVACVDIACGVGEHAKVIDHGPIGPWIVHLKGTHGRKLGIMT